MSDESGQPAALGPPGDAPAPPPAGYVPTTYGAPAPPPPVPTAQPRRGRPVRTVGGILGVLVVIGVKLFALAGLSHLLHGASPVVIFVVLIVAAILLRRFFRFLGR